jgi:hypothetical protein
LEVRARAYGIFPRQSKRALNGRVETINMAATTVWNKSHFPALTGFKSHGRSCGNIEALAARGISIKFQPGIGFGKMIMGTNLYGSVASIRDHEDSNGFIRVQRNLARRTKNLTRDHVRSTFAMERDRDTASPATKPTAAAMTQPNSIP